MTIYDYDERTIYDAAKEMEQKNKMDLDIYENNTDIYEERITRYDISE